MYNEKEYIDDFYGEILESSNFDNLSFDNKEIDPFDSSIDDIDFSSIQGKDFKKSFHKANKLVNKAITKKSRKRSYKKPLSKEFSVHNRAEIHGDVKQIGKIIIPRDRKVIVEGVSKFILDDSNEAFKNIGYHDGRKLKAMVLTINNDSELDFIVQLFNPSMPLEYLYSTSLNLNNKITVGGGEISYSDMLFNILANPMMMYQAKFVFEGINATQQASQPLKFINKNSSAFYKLEPVNLSLQVDPYQFLQNIVTFDFNSVLNRPFVPDGMDVIQYKVLPHTTVAMGFFYDQLQIKRIMYEEAAKSRYLL